MEKKRWVLGWFAKVLGFMIAIYGFNIFVTKPILNGIFDLALQTTGYQVLFNSDIVSFFFTIQGAGALIVIIILASIVTYFEFSVIILLAFESKKKPTLSLLNVCKMSINSFSSLKNTGIIGYFLYSFVLLTISGFGLSNSLFPIFQIPNFITGELLKNSWGQLAVFAIYFVLFLLFCFSIFTLPVMVLEHVSFWQGIRRSVYLIWRTHKQMLLLFISYFALWGLISWLPSALFMKFFHSSVVSLQIVWEKFQFFWPAPLFYTTAVLYFLGKLLLMPLLLTMVTLFYLARAKDAVNLSKEIQNEKQLPQAKIFWERLKSVDFTKTRNRLLLFSGTFFLIGYSGLNLFYLFQTVPDLHKPIVIGHRGSDSGVENTLSLFKEQLIAMRIMQKLIFSYRKMVSRWLFMMTR